MGRGVDPALLAEISKPAFNPVILVELDWPAGALFAHSGLGVINWAGEEWQGVGPFGSIRLPPETFGMASQPTELRLVGLPDDLDERLEAPVRNRRGIVYFGATTEPGGHVLIGNPHPIFDGHIDAMRDTVTSSDGQLTRGVTLYLTSGPSQRSYAEIYHTAEDQERAYPGDTAGRLTINAEAEGQTLTWPE